MKSYGISLGLAIILVLSSFTTLHKSSLKVDTIVIDPGHGGKDPGCQSHNIQEKKVVLDIGLKLGKIIKENLNDVNVIYTRKQDEFLKLRERSDIANKNQADVFLSLHCNAAQSSAIGGTETYAMGIKKSEDNLQVAKRENSVILMEENYEEHYDFNPKSPEAHILSSLQQDNNLEQSLNLASKIEHQFNDRVQRHSRGVKQAGFVVLYRTTMPSVLVEMGFLTNPSDRQFLTSKKGQVYVASGLFRAFRNYKEEMNEGLN